MAECKKSFIAYCDWNTTFKKLSDEEAGRLAKMLFAYVSDENPEAPDRLTDILFDQIKKTLQRDLENYKKVIEKRREAGRKGGIKSGEKRSEQNEANEANALLFEANEANASNNEANASTGKQNEADNDSDNDNDSDSDILLKKETKNKYSIPVVTVETFDIPPGPGKEKSSAKKEKPFSFKSALLEFGFSPDLADEWLMIRKKKKAINSEMSFNNIIEQIKKTNQPPDNVLKIIVNKQWKGFNAEWLLNENSNGNTDNRPKQTNTRKVSGHQYAAGILSEQLAANSESFDYSVTP